MFTPIICGQCTRGRYRPTGADLYECSQCGHELTTTDFVLDPEEHLVCHEGSMHTRLAEAVSGLYEVRPTHGVQGPFIRATLVRALRRQGVFTGTDQVNAANRLKFDEHLPDCGPWYLTKDELRALAAALRWRLASSATVDPRHQAIAQTIYGAQDKASKQPQ